MNNAFARFANRISFWAGQPSVFLIAVLALAGWAVAGRFLGYSDEWQRILDTATTIITFLMVFIIQNSQNRYSAAVQIKLAELLRVSEASPDALLDLEEMPIEELEKLREQYISHAKKARDGRGTISTDDTPV